MADPDDPGSRPPGNDFDDEAWFAPDISPQPAPSPPPGVVYQVSSGGGGDAYRNLRDIDHNEPAWPLEDPGQPPARPPRSRVPPFLIGALVGASLAIASLTIFQLFSQDEDPVVVAPTTVDSIAAETSLPPATTTTLPPTTTTTTEPPPSTTLAPSEPIQAVGQPVEVSDLRLANNGIGPDILIGRSTTEAVGRLVASFGPPDEDTGVIVTDGQYGACPGDAVRFIRFGPLMTVNTVDADGSETFAGYRLDLSLGGLDSRASTLATLSGLRAGDTVADLNTIYNDFTVEIFDEPGVGLFYEILRDDGGIALLRGPVTSADDDGVVTGIWAPDACSTG